ncbi:Polymyxin resistance protein ArnT [Desulfurella amilsii]|uniref:Polymyxin resistance protein ArnT n=1 Tax=Desulfurella amilsii TaxID=1562698 RepID=A0A1X4XUJ0_9BACT|nr:glycosyltransferase family 39 protein [Desulfurella amilsii]OSS41192.1 Polymyxin resistance protein ArnT [Desulfurella amilsii]
MLKAFFKDGKINFVLVLIYIVLIVLFAFRPLSDNNEGLYADIALNMVKTSNFLIPHLDGVVYLEQPPLLYWLSALSLKLFGISEFSARVPVILSGVLLIVFSYLFSKKIFNKFFATFVSLVLVSQICFDTSVSMLMFDMVLTLFFSLAMFSFYMGYKYSDKYYRLFYVFLAVAIFTKGLVAFVLSCLILVPFIVIKKIKLKDLHLLFGVLTFAILSIWFVAVSIKVPSFFYYYFINNQVLRFFGHMYPNDTITGPIYFYVIRLLVCGFPWSVLLFYGIYKIFKMKLYKDDFYLYILLWFFAIFIFFSLSSGKANYYLLPAIFPIAFFATYTIMNEKLNLFYYILFFAGLALFIGSILVKLHYIMFINNTYVEKLPLILLSFIIFVLYFIAFYKKKYLVESIALSNIVVMLSIFLYFSLNVNDFTSKYASLWLKETMKPNTVFIQYRPFWRTSSSVFYLGKDSLLLDDFDDGDLFYGMTLLKNKNEKFIKKSDLNLLLEKHNITIISQKKNIVDYLNKQRFNYRLKRFGNKLVILIDKS